MSKKLLVLTVGLPQSGKSTWVKVKAKADSCPIVNPDSIRLALHGKPFIPSAEPIVWATAKLMVHALFLAGHDTVIVDATNTTEKRRDFWKSVHWRRSYRIFNRMPGKTDMRRACCERATVTCKDQEHLEGLVEAINRMADNWEDVQEHELDEQGVD